jgi:glyoxylase-like metal-dependent hydrolase (beta-lactamase superfamily II)
VIDKTVRHAIGLLFACLFAATSWAAAPFQKTQAPGFYRMMLGRFEVTVLHDGNLDLEPEKLLTRTSPQQVREALQSAFESPVVPTSVNAFLVNTGEKLVLIDAGTGPSAVLGPSVGHLLRNLAASGYRPDQVDEVYLTHLHPDHVGGLAASAAAAFPNAVVRADRRESDYWLSEEEARVAPSEHRPFFAFAAASLKPYIDAQRFRPFEGDTELVRGIRAISAAGHTRGHTTYQVESEGQRMLVWGDVMHVAAVQFAQPQVTIAFDTDSTAAATARQAVFERAASTRCLVAAAHLPFPGLGHLRRGRVGYEFVPLDYVP